VVRAIQPGEEITVLYSPGFFGVGECLCAHCRQEDCTCPTCCPPELGRGQRRGAPQTSLPQR
jgi:hypothetical protein